MPAKASASFRLTPAMRLRTSQEFAQLKVGGRRLVSGCLIANWQVLPSGSNVKVGIITSRKLGNAVARSRARRLLRETFRLHQHDFRQPVAMVLVARSSIVDKALVGVEHDFLAALRQGKLLKDTA